MKKLKIVFSIIIVVTLINNNSKACSSLCLKDSNQVVFGYNYDSRDEIGFVMFNKRDVSKTAVTLLYQDTPAQWISKYGSVTFNAFGKENPYSGMNEKGLTISMMRLDESQYPEIDSRPFLNLMQWVQYQLDNCESVNDVLDSKSKIRISNLFPVKVQYLVADRFGNIATITFIKGEMVYHTGDELPIPLLCNDKYDKSMKSLIEFMDFGDGDKDITKARDLVKGKYDDDRFIKGVYKMKQLAKNTPKNLIDGTFEVLEFIKQPITLWTIVYDITNLKIVFKTKNNQTLRKISFNNFNYDCNSKDVIIDVDKSFNNPKEVVEEYTSDKNKRIILYNRKNYPLENVPMSIFDAWAKYPETCKCVK